jgi:hypothetical protein
VGREEEGGWYGKIKSHLTCGGSQRRLGESHEARPFRGTSSFVRRRSARSVSLGVPPSASRGWRRHADGGRLLAMIPDLGLHVNLIANASRELYRTQSLNVRRTGWVSVAAWAARLRRAPRREAIQSPPHAWGRTAHTRAAHSRRRRCCGDPTRVDDRQRAASSRQLVRRRPHLGPARPLAAWRRYVIGADELWLVNTPLPSRWDSRCLASVPTSRVRVVARPAW